MLQVALDLAKDDFRVLPCAPNGKKPLLEAWPVNATNDLGRAADLWAKYGASCNVGIACGQGFVVVDVDCKDGKPGFESLAKLPPLPATRSVRTPSDGAHLYFKIPPELRISNSAGALAEGVDVRAIGGQVLAPGSTINGRAYVLARDLPMADAPDWLIAKLTEIRVRSSAEVGRHLGALDTPAALAKAERFIRSPAAEAVEGRRNNTAFRVANRLMDWGFTPATLLRLMHEWNAERCLPPLDDAELETTALSACGGSRELIVGVDNPGSFFEVVEPPPYSVVLNASEFLKSITPYTATPADDAKRPPIPWLEQGKFVRGGITTLIAPGSSGKSLLGLAWGAALALGPDATGNTFCGLKPKQAYRVLILNAEDPKDVMENRLAAIVKRFELPREKIWRRIFLQSGKGSARFAVAKKDRKTGAMQPTAEVGELIAFCKVNEIDMVIVDPLGKTHDGNEIDNGELQQVVDIYERIAVETNAAVVIFHHTRKPSTASSESYAGNVDSGRGGTALPNSARVVLTLYRMSQKDGEIAGKPAHERHRYIRLDDAKANWSEMSPTAEWFKLESIEVANGEFVGVPVPTVVFPKTEEAQRETLEALADKIEAGKRVPIADAVQLLSLVEKFKKLSKTTLRDRIVDALSIKVPIAGGKTFVWHKHPTNATGGAIEAHETPGAKE